MATATFVTPVPTGELTPRAHQAAALSEMLDELVAWAGALRTLRQRSDASAAA